MNDLNTNICIERQRCVSQGTVVGRRQARRPEVSTSERELRTRNGAGARVVDRDGVEHIRVEARDGRVLFEYDPVRQSATISIPVGDLTLAAPQGNVNILAGRGLRVESTTADVHIEHARYRGTSFHGGLRRAKWVLDKLQTVVSRLFERARNVYRHTEQLHQTKAGRIRTIVEGDYRVRGRRVDLGAQADVKIDGEKINLG